MVGKSLPLIVLLGPTAIGKTGLASILAEMLDGEIIGADSRQAYQYMDIGTAKPNAAERDRVPHHLIDIIDPADRLTLARFQQMAYATIDDIHRRGKLPLLVGGTGQYITAVTEGWSIPEVPPNEALRAELETFAATAGHEALYDRLVKVDPVAAENIHPNNVRRVVRALEVCIETGVQISELQRKKPPPYQTLELGLMMKRQDLYDRADRRVEQMMARGFLDEVRDLLARGYDRDLPSLTGLGYSQLIEHVLDDAPLDEAVEATKIATHQFIRRQLTWFRGHDNGIVWYDVQHTDAGTIIADCRQWLSNNDED